MQKLHDEEFYSANPMARNENDQLQHEVDFLKAQNDIEPFLKEMHIKHRFNCYNFLMEYLRNSTYSKDLFYMQSAKEFFTNAFDELAIEQGYEIQFTQLSKEKDKAGLTGHLESKKDIEEYEIYSNLKDQLSKVTNKEISKENIAFNLLKQTLHEEGASARIYKMFTEILAQESGMLVNGEIKYSKPLSDLAE